MANYNNFSPWANTKQTQTNLSYFSIRPVSAEDDDFVYKIEPQFNFRPDLLSYVLYDTPKLWWVFAQRNLDVIQDPVFDIKSGVEIYIPKKTNLFRLLGI